MQFQSFLLTYRLGKILPEYLCHQDSDALVDGVSWQAVIL